MDGRRKKREGEFQMKKINRNVYIASATIGVFSFLSGGLYHVLITSYNNQPPFQTVTIGAILMAWSIMGIALLMVGGGLLGVEEQDALQVKEGGR